MNATEDNFPDDFMAAIALLHQLKRELDKPLASWRRDPTLRAERYQLALRIARLKRHIFVMQQTPSAPETTPTMIAHMGSIHLSSYNNAHLDRAALLAQLAEKNPRVAELIAEK